LPGHRGEELGLRPKLFRVIVPVSDIDRAARFYQAVLGLDGVRVSDGRHYFDCDGCILACFDPRADGDDYDPTPNPEWIYIAVGDLGAVYDACRRAGATFSAGEVHGTPAGEIAVRPWCFVDRESTFTGPREG